MFENIFNNQGVLAGRVRDDMKRSLDQSRSIYISRMLGIADPDDWSATTRCVKCHKWWMWGVRDNLNFTCSDCQPKKLEVKHQ